MITKPVIFVSAVSNELHSSRDLVAKTLVHLGYEPRWQDIAPSESGDLRGVLRKWIDQSAGVIQLVGQSYGMEPREADSAYGRVSYTQFEALYARKSGKRVWYLFVENGFPNDATPTEPLELQELQRTYREGIRETGDLRHRFTTPLELENLVLKLRDDLAHLRKRGKQWAYLVIVLLLLISGGTAWVIKRQQEQNIGSDFLHERHDKMQQALIRLAEVEKNQKQSGEKLTQEEQRIRAYAILDKELSLPPGTVARELPALAIEIYNRPDATLLERANAAYALNKFDEAEELNVQLAAQETLAFQENKQAAQEHLRAAVQAHLRAGFSAENRIRYADALAHFRDAEKLTDRTADPLLWVLGQWYQAIIHEALNQHAEAERLVRGALAAILEKLDSKDPIVLSLRNNLGTVLDALGKSAEAEQEHRAILSLRQTLLSPEDPAILESRHNLASALNRQGKHLEAENENRAVLAIRERVLGREHRDTLASRINIAACLIMRREYAQAETELRKVIPAMEKLRGPDHPDTMNARYNLACALHLQDREPEAEQEHRAVLTLRERIFGSENPAVLESRKRLAATLRGQWKLPEAEQEYRRILSVEDRLLGQKNPASLQTCYDLTIMVGAQKRPLEGLRLATRVRDGWKEIYGEENADYKEARKLCEAFESDLKELKAAGK